MNLKSDGKKGKNNQSDLLSKHHGPAHHLKKRGDYILRGFNLSELYEKVKKYL